MTQLAQAALGLAAEAPTTAGANVALNRPETTIRDARYAMFRVARAYVVMKTGKRPKTHSGLITVFGRLALDLTVEERTIAGRLGTAFDRRLVADYDDEPSFGIDDATLALDEAEAFVALARRLLIS